MPRFFVPLDLAAGADVALPRESARHVQVLRLQPGGEVTLFNGQGGEWRATITAMGRTDVVTRVEQHHAIEREAPRAVHLGVGLMAAERMDWLVEKATELGAAALTPIHAAHSNLRLEGARGDKKRERWRAIAVAACEQCGRNRVPEIHAPAALNDFLAQTQGHTGWLLALDPGARAAAAERMSLAPDESIALLSGPEGGFTAEEEDAARRAGFAAVRLGPRTLRAETAPLAALTLLTAL
ncbi:MAG: 16S rRNA (uracil(1498)-N(3))-methyltransferase [Burkholderiaceae bacterium]|nr:MAG: 16S rRNA (uracil(1498)-N(3))-methyltransferase [Burkholderiaceae bacterium]